MKVSKSSEKYKLFDTSKKYDIIYADPPWSYDDSGMPGGAEQHYPTMDIEDIYNLPVNEIASDNCILFIWVTFPLLKEGIRCIEEWGFEYKTIGFNWVKHNKKSMSWFIGTGSYTRSNSEICLIGVKGKPKRINMGIGSVIDTPVEDHSKKPDMVRRKIVELMGDKPRIELFARQRYKGWDCWGNEVPNH